MNKREFIHTGLYSDKAFNVLTYVQHYLESVYFVDRAFRDHYFPFSKSAIVRSPDGEVLIDMTDNIQNIRCKNHCAAAYMRIFAAKIKTALKILKIWECNTQTLASRRLQQCVNAFYYGDTKLATAIYRKVRKISVNDVMLIHDIFSGIKTLNKRFGTDSVKSFIGQPRDPITTELYIAHEEEIERLKDKYQELRDEERDKTENKIDVIQNEIDDLEFELNRLEVGRDNKIKELDKERDAKIAELNEKFKQMLSASASQT